MVAIQVAQTGGTAQSKTAGTTLSLGTIVTTSMRTGDIIVVTTGFDNTTATAPTVTASHTGTASITWTTRITSNSVSATSGAAVRSAIITGVVTAVGTITDVVLTYSASITAKSGDWRVFRYASTTSFAGAVGASGTSATWSVTSSAEAVAGDLIIGVVAVEGTAIPGNDSDTTGGVWTGTLNTGTSGGSAATNVQHKSQYKIATGTVTAVFNGSVTSTDWSVSTLTLRGGTIEPPTSVTGTAVRGGVLISFGAPASGLSASKYIVYRGGTEVGQINGLISTSNPYFVPCISNYTGDGTIDTASYTYTVKSVAGDLTSLSADSTGTAVSALTGKLIKITGESSTNLIGTKLYVNGDDWTVLSDGLNGSYLDLDATNINAYIRFTLPDLELDSTSVIYGLVARAGTNSDSFVVGMKIRNSALTSVLSYQTYLQNSDTPPSLLHRVTTPTAGSYTGAFLDIEPLYVTTPDTRVYEAIVIAVPVTLTQVNKDLQLIWNQRAVVNKSLQVIWNMRAVVNKTLQTIWNVLFGTQVNKDIQLIWNQRSLVNKSSQVIWNDRALTTKSVQTIWNQRALTTKSLQTIWNMRALTTKSLQTIWNMRAPVNKSLQTIWNTLEGVSLTQVNKDLQIIWNNSALVSQTEQLIWNVSAVVNKSLQTIWNQRALVTKSNQLIWRLLNSVSLTRQLIWNDRALVNKSPQLIWNDRAVVNKSNQLIWNDRSLVSKTNQLIWNINQLVGSTKQVIWNNAALVGTNEQLIWNTLALAAQVNKDIQLVWNDRAVVGKNTTLVWNARSLTNASPQLIWGVKTRVNKSLQTIWNDKTLIGKTFQTIWNDRSTSGREVTLTWHVEINYVWIEVTVNPSTWPEGTVNTGTWNPATVNPGTWPNNAVNSSSWVEVTRNPQTWNGD